MSEKQALESVRALIKKVHVLSVRGVAGEAEAAKVKLEMLLKKHKIALEDILSDEMRHYRFYYQSTQEEQLIVQCYVSLGIQEKNYSILVTRRRGRKLRFLELNLTLAQYVDLKFMVAYYKTALKKETDILFKAFVQRHRLFSPTTDEQRETKISAEELKRLVIMMRGLSEKSYFKPAGLIR